MKNIATVLSALALCTAPVASYAAEANDATDYLSVNVGWFDITQQDNEATQLGVEYRMAPIWYGLRPIVGIFGTSDDSVYGYAGLHWDFELLDNLYLSPNFAAGAYSHGDGKDLGGAIEFRSGIEASYEFPNDHRLGVAFNHLSNASIYDHNPGVEVLMVNYSIPLGRLFY